MANLFDGDAQSVVQAGHIESLYVMAQDVVTRPAQLKAVAAVSGRAAERQAIASAFAQDHIVLLSGPPGAGKTTLAMWFAHQVSDAFPDGQLYADLREIEPRDAIVGFVHALLGEHAPVSADPAAQLRSVLAGRRVLVVVDNARPAHVELFRPAGAGSALIATGRDHLGGIELGLMTTDDSLALLRDRIGPRVDAEPAAARAFVQVCGRLPLALTVAASLANLRATADLAALVREIPDERDEVHASFFWSYQHLPPETARVFRLLGLGFESEFAVEAIAALAGLELSSARKVRNELLRAHLLENALADRLTMHDLIRSFARERAEHEEPEAVRNAAVDRLLDHYVATVSTELENARQAVRIACASSRSAHVRDLAMVMAEAYETRRHTGGWEEVHTAAVSAARALGDLRGEALALANLGHAVFALGRVAEAESHHLRALEICRERRALTGLGNVRLHQGRKPQAVQLFTEVLRTAERDGDVLGQARSCRSLGRATDDISYFERARQLSEETGDVPGVGWAWNGMGVLHHRAGRHTEAIACYEQAVHALPDCSWLVNLGLAHAALGASDNAVMCYRLAPRRALEAQDKETLAQLGRLLHDVGQPDQAMRCTEAAESLYLTAADRGSPR